MGRPGARPDIHSMKNDKEIQCNIRGVFPLDKDDLFHYITISLLVVVIAISLSPRVIPPDICDEHCQKRLEGKLQTLLEPTLQLANVAIENLNSKAKTFQSESSNALKSFDKTISEVHMVKTRFEQTHNDFQDGVSKTKQEFSEATSDLQQQTKVALEEFKSKAGEAVSLLEGIKTTTENHFSGIRTKSTESTDTFIKAQQDSIDTIKTRTNEITTKAQEVSNNVEQSMNEIKETAQRNYANFGQTQKELLDKTGKDVLEFANRLKTESDGISKQLSDLVVEVTKTISDNVEDLQKREDVLFQNIDGTLEGVMSSIDNMSKSTDSKLEQAMKKLQTTAETTINSIQSETGTRLMKIQKTMDETLGKVQINSKDAIDTMMKTSEKVITSLEKNKESTEKAISASLTKLEETTTGKMDEMTSKVDASVTSFKRSQDDSMGKIGNLATKAIEYIEKSTNGVVDLLQKSGTLTQEKINNSIAVFEKKTEKTVNHLQNRTDSSIEKLEKAQFNSYSRIEKGARLALREIENRGRAIFAVLDQTKIRWRTSVYAIAASAEDDKRMVDSKRIVLQELNDQTENLKTSVKVINEHEKDIVNRTSVATDTIKATAVTIEKTLFESSVNFYITWCLLAAIFMFSWTRQGSGNSKYGTTIPPATRTIGGNRQESKPTFSSRDRHLNIPSGPPKYDITVVTFSSECLAKAPALFSKAVNGKAVQYRMLTGSLDLSDVPSSRGYVVLIGTDARNTILEDMDGSAGSRKRETVAALQKTQGDVLVVYLDNNYHDVEDPPEGMLVNPHLQRTSTHPILKALVSRQRLITLRREAWNSAQTEHLIGWTRRLR